MRHTVALAGSQLRVFTKKGEGKGRAKFEALTPVLPPPGGG